VREDWGPELERKSSWGGEGARKVRLGRQMSIKDVKTSHWEGEGWSVRSRVKQGRVGKGFRAKFPTELKGLGVSGRIRKEMQGEGTRERREPFLELNGLKRGLLLCFSRRFRKKEKKKTKRGPLSVEHGVKEKRTLGVKKQDAKEVICITEDRRRKSRTRKDEEFFH